MNSACPIKDVDAAVGRLRFRGVAVGLLLTQATAQNDSVISLRRRGRETHAERGWRIERLRLGVPAGVAGAEVGVNHADDLAVAEQPLLFDERLQFGKDVPAAGDLGIRAEEVEFIAPNHDLDPNRLANFAEVSVSFSKQGADEVLILEIDRCF
jgi:hypothetical protein